MTVPKGSVRDYEKKIRNAFSTERFYGRKMGWKGCLRIFLSSNVSVRSFCGFYRFGIVASNLRLEFTCQGNPFSGNVDLQHFDLDHIANGNDLVGVTHELVSQLGNVN